MISKLNAVVRSSTYVPSRCSSLFIGFVVDIEFHFGLSSSVRRDIDCHYCSSLRECVFAVRSSSSSLESTEQDKSISRRMSPCLPLALIVRLLEGEKRVSTVSDSRRVLGETDRSSEVANRTTGKASRCSIGLGVLFGASGRFDTRTRSFVGRERDTVAARRTVEDAYLRNDCLESESQCRVILFSSSSLLLITRNTHAHRVFLLLSLHRHHLKGLFSILSMRMTAGKRRRK